MTSCYINIKKLLLFIPQKGNFDLGLFPMVSYCTVSAFGLRMLRLYHMMFCLQSQQYIIQQEFFKNGHTLGKTINQYHTHRFGHTLPRPQNNPLI